MSTNSNGRVLVLENRERTLDIYVRQLRAAGFEAEGHQTLDGALEALDERLFGVCVVDLMLDDPHSHDSHDGTHLLVAAAALDEGTQCIILSGQDRPEVAASIVSRVPVHSYIEKGTYSQKGPHVLEQGVVAAMRDVPADANSSVSKVWAQMYGASGVDSSIAETNLTAFLSPKGGVSVLKRAFGFGLLPLLPLHGRIPSASPWTLDQATHVASKSFWSKGLGHAVRVTVSSNGVSEQPGEIHRAEHADLTFVAAIGEGRRDQFAGMLPNGLRHPLS